MNLQDYKQKDENHLRKYYLGNGLFDELDYSGYQERGDGHGIAKNYRIGSGDKVKINDYDFNMIYGKL